MSAANKRAVRRYFEEALSRGDLAVLDSLLAPDFVFHSHLRPEGTRGVERFKEVVFGLHLAFADVRFRVEDLIAEGDHVVCRFIAAGTHEGVFMGVEPDGRRATFPGVDPFRLSGGGTPSCGRSSIGWTC